MRLFRIADARYGPESGDGARLFGGRWISPGRAVIYACATYSGAMLEKLVHTGRQIPKHQVCVTFNIPDEVAPLVVVAADIPGWNPADLERSRAVGDEWLAKASSAVLLVPSVVFGVENNALINPTHKDTSRMTVVSINPIHWDERLF